MLRLNKETRTLTGQSVTPYMVENGYIYCWDRSGKTVVKRLNDFKTNDLSPSIERIIGGATVSVSPVYRNTIKQIPTVEVEVSRPTVGSNTEINEIISTVNIGDAVLVTPNETVDEKIVYVHVEPAIDNNLFDGEMQVGGVEVVTPEEAEERIVFDPNLIDDDDYI